jgi:dihydrofolate synthase/folylpolyglutamate synthase
VSDLTQHIARLGAPALPGIHLSLGRMEALLGALGHPERQLPSVIHLAGTNGKGSTLAYLNAIYQAAGYRVHAYTSPHLVRYNERIQLAGKTISDADFIAAIKRVLALQRAHPVTEFEGLTAAAFLCFSAVKADILLLETGMGGRLDATNTVPEKLATILTSIGMDHQEFLGATLAEIAAEKAAIMRAGVPCISAPQRPEAAAVIRAHAARIGTPLHVANAEKLTHTLALPGAHQRINAAVAATTVTLLQSQFPVSEATITTGLAQAVWPARLQTLKSGALVEAWGTRGKVLLDGGHNADAAAMLAEWLKTQDRPVTLLVGLMARKDAATFLAPFAAAAARILTIPIPDAPCHTPDALASAARALGFSQVEPCASLGDAARRIAGLPDAPAHLLVAGSLYLAGEILKNHG